MAEHPALTRTVVGSNPTSPAIRKVKIMIHVKHPTKEQLEKLRQQHKEVSDSFQEKKKKVAAAELTKKRQDMRNFLATNAPPCPKTFPAHWALEQCAKELARWRYAYADAMLAELEVTNE